MSIGLRLNFLVCPFLLLVATPVSGFARTKSESGQQLRGAMVSTFATAADLRDLAALGANHVRWQLTWGGFPSYQASTEPLSSYTEWLEGALRHVDTMLPHCRLLGLRVVLDLHTPPGGHDPEKHWRLFKYREHQLFFIECWRRIATRYRGDTTIWAFDLMNEPNEDGHCADSARPWRELAHEAAATIRAVDPTRRLVLEAAPNGDSRALAALKPLPLSNVVYSFHMYDPVDFTHQRIGNDTSVHYYPGEFYGSRWGRRKLRRWHKPVRAWQEQHRVPVYVGEFSAVRWAPGRSAHRYLRDCISIYEKYGWGWAYHAWRESDVWSVEHSADRDDVAPTAKETDRLKLLRKAFSRNK